MQEIFKAFVGIFMLLLLMVGGVSIIGAGIDARNADSTKTSYVAELENSNFSPKVINGLFEDAAQQGHRLKLVLYGEDGARTEVTAGGQATSTTGVYMARVELGFDYSFALLDAAPIPHTILGYAR